MQIFKVRGNYTIDDVQQDGLVSEKAVLRHQFLFDNDYAGDIRVWDTSITCLRWEMDPELLERAASQLVGKTLFLDLERIVNPVYPRWADTAIWLEMAACETSTVDPEKAVEGLIHLMARSTRPDDDSRKAQGAAWTCLAMRNQLTKASATHLLHFLYHLGTGTYVKNFFAELFISRMQWTTCLVPFLGDNTGDAQINPAIFEALRQARGGKKLELYTRMRVRLWENMWGNPTKHLKALEDGVDARLHFNQTLHPS